MKSSGFKICPQILWDISIYEVQFLFYFFAIPLEYDGDRKGNPLQCSCLEDPRDGGAWWAAVYGVGHDWRDLAAAEAWVWTNE